jgi:RNA polymerase sigma-70 factor (ECF subfamily)
VDLDAIYREHHRELARFVRIRLGRSGDVADVCQDIWAAVVNNLSQLIDQTALRSWLFAIARNKTSDARRHHGAYEALDAELGEGGMLAAAFGVRPPTTPCQALARRRRAAALLRALALLRPEERALIELHFGRGLKPREIVGLLDGCTTANTVAQRIVRARRRLRHELAQQGILP